MKCDFRRAAPLERGDAATPDAFAELTRVVVRCRFQSRRYFAASRWLLFADSILPMTPARVTPRYASCRGNAMPRFFDVWLKCLPHRAVDAILSEKTPSAHRHATDAALPPLRQPPRRRVTPPCYAARQTDDDAASAQRDRRCCCRCHDFHASTLIAMTRASALAWRRCAPPRPARRQVNIAMPPPR